MFDRVRCRSRKCTELQTLYLRQTEFRLKVIDLFSLEKMAAAQHIIKHIEKEKTVFLCSVRISID